MPETSVLIHRTAFASAKGALAFGYAVLTAIVMFFAGWAANFPLAGAIIAQGVIEIENNTRSIEHPLGGVVGRIFVREGDVVAAGDLLFTLQTTALDTQLELVTRQLDDLDARRAMLVAERDGHEIITFDSATTKKSESEANDSKLLASYTELFKAKKETANREIRQLRQQIIQISSMIEGTRAQLFATRKQRVLVEKNLVNSRALLSQGLTQSARVSDLEYEIARLDGALGQYKADIARAKAEQARLEIAILRVTSIAKEKAATELQDLETRKLELEAQKSTLDAAREKMHIRASIAGIVHDNRVIAEGTIINPSEPVMQLVPRDRPQHVIVQLAPPQIDQVEFGQTANIRLMSHFAKDHPLLEGTVEHISAQALVDDKSGAPFFSVHISLKDQTPHLGSRRKIIAGMQAEVYLRTKDRTALLYLFDPLLIYIKRAFRET